MTLTVDVRLRRGELALAITAAFPPGPTVLIGANGAGKSTFFMALAGVLAIDEGRVALGEVVFDDTARGVHLAPEARGIGWVPQGSLLFPHLDAAGNVAFAIAARHPDWSRRTVRQEAERRLAAVGAEPLAARAAGVLSGGERQRVALARALASEPRMLLLDEPLTAIDTSARVALRALVADLLKTLPIPSIVVTHDEGDAAALVARGAGVMRLADGALTRAAVTRGT